MPLEAGDGFVSGLVATNPVNATDQVAQGDDHIRLIKAAVKGSFPNVNGAVNFTPAEANVLVGIATLFNLDSVTVDMDGTTWTADYTTITLTGGSAVLLLSSSTAALTGAFTATGNVTVNPGSSGGGVLNVSAANLSTSDLRLQQGGSNRWFVRKDGTSESGANAGSNFAINARADDGSDIGVAFAITRATRLVTMAVGASMGALTVTGSSSITTLTASGALTTPNTGADEIGFKGAPQNIQNGNYGIVLTDCGKTIYKASGGAGETITIPANGTIAIPVGSIIRVVNNGGGDLTIAITTDTLSLAGVGTNGSRVLSDHGVAVLEKVASQEWFISGVGVS